MPSRRPVSFWVTGSRVIPRISDRLVLTARHVVAPVLAGPRGQLLVRPVGVMDWLPARVVCYFV
jgi:hypothetical protein